MEPGGTLGLGKEVLDKKMAKLSFQRGTRQMGRGLGESPAA